MLADLNGETGSPVQAVPGNVHGRAHVRVECDVRPPGWFHRTRFRAHPAGTCPRRHRIAQQQQENGCTCRGTSEGYHDSTFNLQQVYMYIADDVDSCASPVRNKSYDNPRNPKESMNQVAFPFTHRMCKIPSPDDDPN